MNVATAPEVDPTKPPPAEYLPDYDQFVTEDDAPVDNFFSEKQQRLLTEPLYSARKKPASRPQRSGNGQSAWRRGCNIHRPPLSSMMRILAFSHS